MLDANAYISQFTACLQQKYGARLLYVGLQGSYLRGEATEHSDLDLMVVVEGLSVPDLDAYRDVIQSVGEPEKACGFICSREDLAHWNPLELCHLLHSTKDYYGQLAPLLPPYTQENLRDYIKLSINELYHALCHRYLHASQEANRAALPAAYKPVFFILQDLYYLEHGRFIQAKAELLPLLTGQDRLVLAAALRLAKGETLPFEGAFSLLFSWCQETLKRL